MSSARKIRANRINARASTGPKTSAGRARVARNALRHGLNVPLRTDPTFSEQIAALADKIVGPHATPEIHDLAVEVAEAQIDLQRARSARYRALLSVGSGRKPKQANSRNATKVAHKVLQATFNNPHWLATVLDQWSERLVVINRYIQRAHSRRQAAVEALERVRKYSAERQP